jgi:hypothetical protein
MGLVLTPVADRRALRDFVRLPYRLRRHDPTWCPPLISDERRTFDARRNRAMAYCDHALWLARDARGTPVARIAGIINRRHDELSGEPAARFSHLEAPDDAGVVRALLDAVLEWAAGRAAVRVIGPMGFTDQDPAGFALSGFDEPPSVATCQNPAYLPRLVEGLGWSAHEDYVVYRVPVAPELPAAYHRILSRVTARGGLRLLEFRRRRELAPLVHPILDLMNESFTGLSGYSFLDRQEISDLAARFMPVIDPRFVKVVLARDAVVGFIIAIPDVSAGLRRAGGRLLPLGWLHIRSAARRARRLDLLLGGVRHGFRHRGVDVLLGAATIRSAHEAGLEYMDSHHELASNMLVRAEMERNGGVVYRLYRLYQHAV